MKPFSENIVFWDTEFSSGDPHRAEIISVGMVKFTGEELYLELELPDYINEWVAKVVVPMLGDKKVSRNEARERIDAFLGDGKPHLVCDWDRFDVTYLYKLYDIGEKNPKDMRWNWYFVDFRSLLFGLGIDPERMSGKREDNLYRELGINDRKYREHHALDDAKLLREVYLGLLSQQ